MSSIIKGITDENLLATYEKQLEGIVDENLRKWFKEKWVRFGPDGKIRGDCARGDDSEGKPKCLPQKKAHALGKKGRASAASRKRRQDPNPERRGKAKNVATKKKTNEGSRGIPSKAEMLFDKMFELRTKAKMATDRQRYKELDLIKQELENLEQQVLALPNGQVYLDKFYNMLGTDVQEQKCPECGNEMVNEELMNEKKDACYYKVKSRYKVWPSAYASGALVKCRKKGASNWGNKSKAKESVDVDEGQIYSTGGGPGEAQRWYKPKPAGISEALNEYDILDKIKKPYMPVKIGEIERDLLFMDAVVAKLPKGLKIEQVYAAVRTALDKRNKGLSPEQQRNAWLAIKYNVWDQYKKVHNLKEVNDQVNVNVPGYGTIPLEQVKKHIQKLSEEFNSWIQAGEFMKAAYYSEQLFNALFALARALKEIEKNSLNENLNPLLKNIISQNPKGSADEKILLGKFLGSDQGTYAKNVIGKDHKKWIEHIAFWLKKNQPKLQREFTEVDFSDIVSLAHDMYETYLAKQGQLEENLNEFFDTSGGGDDDDELKRQVIEMYKEDGLRETEISRITGLSELAVNNIIDQYERGDFTIDEGYSAGAVGGAGLGIDENINDLKRQALQGAFNSVKSIWTMYNHLEPKNDEQFLDLATVWAAEMFKSAGDAKKIKQGAEKLATDLLPFWHDYHWPKKNFEDQQLDELKCWPGYTRVRGVPAGAPGSCKKKTKESSILKGISKEDIKVSPVKPVVPQQQTNKQPKQHVYIPQDKLEKDKKTPAAFIEIYKQYLNK